MHDEIDRRNWAEHHHEFALSLDRGLATLGARMAGLLQRTPVQAMAVISALTFTALSFTSTTA